jgi:hypothetical protein
LLFAQIPHIMLFPIRYHPVPRIKAVKLAICPIICGRLDLARRATRMTAKRHIECSVAMDRRFDRCNRERISDRSRLGFEGGSHLLENKTLAALDKSTSKCIFSLCKIPGYDSWPEHAHSPSMVRNHAVPRCRRSAPCGAASSIRAFTASKTWSNVSGTAF